MSYQKSFSMNAMKQSGFMQQLSGVLMSKRVDITTESLVTSMETMESSTTSSSVVVTSSSFSTSGANLYVVKRDYVSEEPGGLSLQAGEIVEVLDMNPEPGSKRARMDPDFEVSELLDTSMARHKMAIRPKRRHTDSRHVEANGNDETTNGSSEARWIVKQAKTGGSGFVPSNILRKRHDDADANVVSDDPRRARDAVVRELIETEQELGRDLNFVLEKYMRAIDAGGTKVPRCVRENKDLIFSNFRKICEFHNTVLIEGVKYYAHEPKMLGKTFLRLERDFDLHCNYCRDEPAAQEFLAENDEAREYFAELSHQLGDDKSLSEHLKLPIQRINDYQLLLKELAKYSEILKENPSDLNRAIDFMLAVPTRANDAKFISSIEGYRGNIHKLGRLLRHDWFTVTDAQGKSKERYLFLFKARILVCKVKRISDDRSVFILKDIVKLPEVEVNDLPDDPLSYQLVHTQPDKHPRYPITLKAHAAQAKPNWLQEIKQYTKDATALAEHAADDLQIIEEGEAAAVSEDKSHKSSASESSRSRSAAEPEESQKPAPKPAEVPKSASKPAEAPKSAPAPPSKPAEAPKPAAPTPVVEAQKTTPTPASPAAKPAEVPAPKAAEPAKPAQPTQVPTTPAASTPAAAPISKPEPTPAPAVSPAPAPASTTVSPVPAPVAATVSPAPAPAAATVSPAPAPAVATVIPAPAPAAATVSPAPAPVAATVPAAPAPAAAPASVPVAPQPAPASTVAAQTPTPIVPAVPAQPAKMSETILETQSITQTVQESVTTTVSSSSGVAEKQSLRLNITTQEETTFTSTEGQSSIPATPTSPPPTPLRDPNLPRFSKTIEPHSCEPGETTKFECELMPGESPASLTWLKDNKPLDDRLADRVSITSEADNTKFKLSMLHCRESDSGTYTAHAANQAGASTCSALLVVQELTPEEKARRAAEKGAMFLVKLKDTQVLEDTYLRFMIKAKGDPNPVIKFFKDDQLITEENSRIKVVSEKAEQGFYELVVPHVQPQDAGKYSCSVMNKYGEDKCEANVKVVAEKNAFSGLRETIVKPGESPDFKWLRDGKPFDPEERFKVLFKDEEDTLSLVFQHVTPEDAGLYTCVASTTTGKISCSAELTVQGSVNQLQKEPEKPQIITESTSTDSAIGASAMLELKVKGFPKPDIKWTHDGKDVVAGGRFRFLYEDEESMALVIKGVEASDGGKYHVVAKNELGESALDLEVLVKAPPKFRTKLEDRKAMTEENLVLEIEIDGCPKPEIKWFKDGKQITSSDHVKITSDGIKQILTVDKAKIEDSGAYSIVATNDVSSTTEYFKVSVSAPPKFLKELSKTMEARETDSISLDVKIHCSPAPQVKWYICKPSVSSLVKEYKMEEGKEEIKVDGKHVIMSQDGENYTLKLVGVTRADSGYYRCVASNEFGSSNQECEVNIKCAPQLTSKLENTTVKEGDTQVTLIVGVNAYPEPKIKWFLNDVEITESRKEFAQSSHFGTWKLTLKEVTSEMAGKYTCKINNELGSNESSANYTVLNKPRFPKPLKDTEVDEGQTLNLSATVFAVPAATVKWYKNGSEVSADARIKITKEGSETYNLSVTLVKGQDAGDYEARATNEQGTTSTISKVKISKIRTTVTRDEWRSEETQQSEGEASRQLSEEQQGEAHAVPTILSHTLNESKIYESLATSYEVHAEGIPRPEAKWFKDGTQVKSDKRIKVSEEGKVYKLELTDLLMEDAGVYKCVISNRLGEKSQETTLKITSVNEFRKPTTKTPLAPLIIKKNEPGTLTCVLVADPLPDFTWSHDGKEISHEEGVYEMNMEHVEVEDGLKECTLTLTLPSGQHKQTGEYKLFTKNKYGEDECSARLDVYLVPEIDGLKDQTTIPYETIQFEVVILSNPKPKVTWTRGEEVITNCEHTQLIADIEAEVYRIVITNIGLGDDGLYTVTASNSQGESQQQAVLKVHTEVPSFVTAIEDQTIMAYHDVDFRVRVAGVPKPHIKWFKEGKELVTEGRFTVDNDEEHQVSGLMIEKLAEADPGVYSVTASNLVGQAECSAQLAMAQIKPGFAKPLEKNWEVDEGDKLEIKTKLDGSPIPVVKWYKDGEELVDDGHVKLVALPDGTVELTIDSVKPTDCGAYKLVATNRNGEKTSICAVAVKPNPRKPVFVKPLEDVKAKAEESVKLQCQIMGFPAPEIHWYKDGHLVRGTKNISFVNSPGGVIGIHFDKVRPEDAGRYSLKISNRLGDLSAVAVVEIEAAERKPVFQSPLQLTKVVEGYPAKLEIKVYGHPLPKLTWTHRGTDIVPDGKHYKEVVAPDGTVSLLIDKARPEDAGEYSVMATNSLGDASCKAKLEVTGKNRDAPEEVPAINPFRDFTTEEGSPLVMDAAFLGNPIPEVEWTRDGELIEAGGRITLTCDGKRVGLEIRPAELGDAGRYECKLTNSLGKASSGCTVGVRKVYQPPTFKQGFNDLQQIPGYDAKFIVRVSGMPAPDITWSKGGVDLPGRETEKFQIKRDGDACVLFIRECTIDDAGTYVCTAKNKAGEAFVAGALEVVDKIGKKQKAEAPILLKKLGDCEVYQGMTARFTACVSGFPEPEIEWYRDNTRIFSSDRVKFEREKSGLLRLVIEKVGEADVAKYKLRVVNEHGEAECDADLTYDSLDDRPRLTMSDQYQDYDSLRKSGAPMPLADRPIVSRMTDRHLTLSWKPSIPKGPREPVTYRVEMCELPGGEWFNIRTDIRSCACDIRNLEPFRDYKFRVRVENKYGLSDPSPYAITYREKLEPDPPKFFPYIEPNIDFRPETSPFFAKDFDIEKPPHDGFAQAPKFLQQERDSQYGVKGHNCQLTWFVYGYPKPKMTFYFGDELIEMGGRYDCSYTRNGQATLFINKMMDRDVGIYEACARNEHGESRQRVHLDVGEYPRFTKRPEETVILARKTGQLEAKLTGVPFPELKWYKDWLPIAPSSRIKMHFHEPDTAVLVISEAMSRDEGLYSLTARNPAGAVSCSVTVRIEESESAFAYATYSGRSALRELKPNKNRFIEEFYDIGNELGRGTQGVAYHAVERLTGRNYAAKVMHGKDNLKPFMLNELEIYNQLNHRKLLRLQDVFETKRSLTLITELASGGELLDVLTREEHITESLIAGYIRQVLQGLEHLHSQNIAHLGLTPGDLLITHPGGDDLKICDFGLSRKIFWGKLVSLNYGMPEFVAPEVANGDGVHMAADMWSLGVITLLFLTGVSPFRGSHDRETLSRVREGKWSETTLFSSSNLSEECRDFIKSLLSYTVEGRMDVKTALKHPWLSHADKLPANEHRISTEGLRQYYKGLKDWYTNASCRTWYRRKPLDNADIHPSCMIYPPGLSYTPPRTPEHTPEPGSWENKIPSRDGIEYEEGTYKSESHYQYGPDTYLLQLRDVDFPCRLREYMKVAATRSEAFARYENRDWRAPVIRERRRFTDIMDEEIDDERKDRISRYGNADTYTLRRLRRELGTRLDGQVEAEALVESKRDGQPPFLREKPQLLPIVEDQNAKLTCLAVGEPKPIVQWFKNDNLVNEGKRIKVTEDADGRSVLSFDPAMSNDAGIYKVVARNRVGQTVARARVVLASPPCAPDSPEAVEISDTEVLLRWKQPKDDGNSTVLCYSLQYKEADKVDWHDCASNIDHEFYLVRNLTPNIDYHFRLSACNRIGWSDKGIPTNLVHTKETGAPKVTGCTRAMLHLQQLTESGQPVQGLSEVESALSVDYHIERSPLTWKDENPAEKFNFISEIARGRFSLVAKAIEKSTDRVVMAKVLSWTPETETDVLREFEAWHSLRHERICGLVEAYKFNGAATFILEKLQGSDVLTYLASRHEYSEQVVSFIITQVLDGLQYLHWRGICHLGIEPDNVVMAGVRSAQVKLVDFGSSQRVSKLGTGVPRSLATEFSAPEILGAEPAFPQSDVWSVGVLTYLLLSGISPYRAATVEETRQNITYVRYRFEHLYKELTAEATRFIMLLFKRTPCKRPTAEECHEHRWLLPTEHLIKKRERAVFLGNRLKEFSEQYHGEKVRAAATAEEQRPSAIPTAAKLARSISVQEELLTPC